MPAVDSHAAPARNAIAERAVARVRQYIEQHLSERLTLAQLAGVGCMSRYHFARLFRRVTGSSPMEYVLQRRIDRARLLLRERRHRIGDIAVDLGFFDQSHFARSFRRATGDTPGRFARADA